MQAAMEALGAFNGREETGLHHDAKALGEAFSGFWDLLKTCRPIRYQAVVGLLLAIGTWLWGGGILSWLLWVLIVCVGLGCESINSSDECGGATQAKVAFMVDCVVTDRQDALLDEHGRPLPLSKIPRKRDPEFARNAHQAAAITVIAAMTVSTLFTIIVVCKP
jgi:diacylglycerol kinase